MITNITYHVERFNRDWEPCSNLLSLEEARVLSDQLMEQTPQTKLRIVETKVVENVFEEYVPSDIANELEMQIKALIQERNEALNKLEQYRNCVAAQHINLGL